MIQSIKSLTENSCFVSVINDIKALFVSTETSTIVLTFSDIVTNIAFNIRETYSSKCSFPIIINSLIHNNEIVEVY